MFVNKKLSKLIVGLALINDFFNGRLNQTLLSLYSNPTIAKIRTIHDRNINSTNHFDREVAFWLALNLKQKPLKIHLNDLIVELREMEVILSSLLWQVTADTQRDFNDWLNYMINAAHSVQDRYWMDAKSFMSRAVQSSQRQNVEKIKRNPTIGYKVRLLQTETLRCFEQIKRFPTELRIPEEYLDSVLEVQEIMIELKLNYHLQHPTKEISKLIENSIKKLNSALRYLMHSNLEDASKELERASDHMEWQIGQVTARKTIDWARKLHERIKTLNMRLHKLSTERQRELLYEKNLRK